MEIPFDQDLAVGWRRYFETVGIEQHDGSLA